MVSKTVDAVLRAEEKAAADVKSARTESQNRIAAARTKGEELVSGMEKAATAEANNRIAAAQKDAEGIMLRGGRDAEKAVNAFVKSVESRRKAAIDAAFKIITE